MNDEVTYIGTSSWGAERVPFGISQADRRRHLYTVGKTGAGKSTLLENLIMQDIHAGRGVAFLDPLGDSAERIIDNIPGSRLNDVVYFNPSDLEHPVGFNVVESVPADLEPVVTAGVVATFKHIWADSWGARLEWILYNTVASVLSSPNTTILSVSRMLRDDQYRNRMIPRIKDPVIANFWKDDFDKWDKRQRVDFITSTVNKLDQFINAPSVRNILGQTKSSFDIRYMMDNNKIFIANLSKGSLGEERAHLLGALLVTKFQLSAMSRGDIPEEDRQDFHLVIDELQNFVTDTIATVLSEARKYRLGLTLSHQYLGQLTPSIRSAVFGNVDSIVSFRVGDADAEDLAPELDCVRSVLTDLQKFEVRTRLLERGNVSQPFLGQTNKPLVGQGGRYDQVVARSRRHFARDRKKIEPKINQWLLKIGAEEAER